MASWPHSTAPGEREHVAETHRDGHAATGSGVDVDELVVDADGVDGAADPTTAGTLAWIDRAQLGSLFGVSLAAF